MRTKYTGKIYVCQFCYKHVTKKKAYDNHINRCRENPAEYTFPKIDYIEFDRIYSTLRYPAVVYADFEVTNLPVKNRDSTIENAILKQIPNSFCIFCPEFEILEVRYNESLEELFKEF
jgi:hypothetical protein